MVHECMHLNSIIDTEKHCIGFKYQINMQQYRGFVMHFPVRRRWVFIALLSIIALLISLGAFWLAGVLRGSLTPETFTVDVVAWEMERHSKYTRIEEIVENVYNNYTVLINASVSIHSYFENGLAAPYGNRDGIAFTVSVNATAFEGSIASIVVEFLPLSVNSTIYFDLTFSRYYNVTVTRIKGIGANTGVTYIEGKASGSPCSMRLPLHWVFTDQNIENHQLKVNIKVTYSNGETYQTIVVPIVLNVLIVSI